MRIEEWLAGLGLGAYASRFAENDIDFPILPDLTDQDLEKIGVASLGHRRKILRAIAELGTAAQSIVPAQLPTASTPSATAIVTPGAAGERRYLTVMFCDLVGSTSISAQLDAEEWRDLVGAYLDAASAAVTEMGGHVAKKLGDGLMSLFGYPVAHENDAERAARAALAIQRALAELNRRNIGTRKPELTARIGLESGQAVVDTAGEIYGDVANVAARVQALAEPGAVLVTARVQRQVAGLFVAEEHGTHTLKGVPEPAALFKLVRASGGGRRSGQRNLTPLVGRDEEIAMLLRRWERARQGDGQLVMMVGEPGLGKSRLLEEFHARLSDTPHTWVEWSCSQLLQNTPLHPIAEWGRQRFGGADVPAERRFAELESALAQVKLDPAENVSLLAPLLDIPLPPGRAPTLAPEELRRRQLATLTNWVMAGARAQSLVLAFEDLHWADPTTLDVLRGIAERGALAPLLIVATTRPEFRPPWSMRSHHGTISLAPLDRAQVRDMVAELSARHALPRDVVEDVAARTGGVPLFVEEVTRLLLERGEQGGGIEAIPPTLQQSLMARLDRLGPAREVAQIGSVIGRGFSYGLLRDVAGMEEAALQAALEKLADADIVLVQGLPPDSDYRFKHALIQDAAYENLLKSRRQVLHRRVAEILRDRFADTAAAEPEALAYHFTQAGMTDTAIEWWGKAGDQALRRSAFQEAISHLGKAIEMADKAGEAAPRTTAAAAPASQRLKLQTNMANALLQARGQHSPETQEAFTRARELASGTDDPLQRFSSYYGVWVGGYVRGEKLTMTEAAEALVKEAESRPDTAEACIAHRIYGVTCWVVGGDVTIAREHIEKALALYRPERDRDLAHRFAQDVGVAAKIYLSLVLWVLGEPDRARGVIKEALALAAETKHVPTAVYAHSHAAILEMLRFDPDAAKRHAEAGLARAREHGVKLWTILLPQVLAWAIAYRGRTLAEWEQMRGAVTDCHAQGIVAFNDAVHCALLARGLADAGRVDEALATVGQSIAESERSGIRWFDAECHRIRGEILWKRDPADTAPAEEAFLTAIAIAQQQKAKSFELRAALSLAKLYRSIGRAADAHAVLSPALEGFSPTPEFPEIEEAQALLAALAETDEVKNAAAARQRRLKLQTSLANALLQARGMHSAESREAFGRARDLAGGIDDPLQRLSSYYGVWVSGYMRCDKATMMEAAESALHESKSRPDSAAAGIAHRIYGITCWMVRGDLATAQNHLMQAVALYRPERDRDLAHRFAQDVGVAAFIYLSFVEWVLGEPDRARAAMEQALALATETKHPPTIVHAHYHAAWFETFRLDWDRAKAQAEACFALAGGQGLEMWTLLSPVMVAWANACSRGTQADWEEMQSRLAASVEKGVPLMGVIYRPLLAAGQAATDQVDVALATIDEAVATTRKSGICFVDAENHRIRGEILLKRDPANTAAAEEEFLTAIAIARQQKAKSFELRAALTLAKLYQSTGRAADAHAVLAPALEGFAPTPEFPEIAEAQTLLTALAETDEVKSAASSRQRRLALQVSYGQAMMHARGYSAPETAAVFARARELASGTEEASERFSTYYGLWAGGYMRGDPAIMLENAAAARAAVGTWHDSSYVCVVHRMQGVTKWAVDGDISGALADFEQAAALYDPERDRESAFRFGQDIGVSANAYLAVTLWQSGQPERGRAAIERMMSLASGTGHAATLAYAHYHQALFEAARLDARRAKPHAEASLALAREHGMPLWQLLSPVIASWAIVSLEGAENGLREMERAIAACREQRIRAGGTIFLPHLALAQAEVGQIDDALATMAAVIAELDGGHFWDAEAFRIRAELLLKADPANPAAAEGALQTAIAVAQQQGARSFELRAALSLAKLYQSTGRAAEAHAVLVPALAGFAPTPEFPEIEEAQTLLAALTA